MGAGDLMSGVEVLPVTAVTVDTVSVPVVVIHAQGAVTADLRAFTPVVDTVDVSTISKPSNAHVASEICSPMWPRLSAGWRARVGVWVGAAFGVAALTVGLTALVKWLA